jgi:penicillin-binding protein 1A
LVRIDRGSGKPVFGGWPTDDPKSGVIWEAFKPESEPRRAIRRGEVVAKPKEAKPVPRREGRPESDFLQRQGGIY